jgi:hypothetical protein
LRWCAHDASAVSCDQFPEGMEDASKIPNLVRGMMERDYC